MELTDISLRILLWAYREQSVAVPLEHAIPLGSLIREQLVTAVERQPNGEAGCFIVKATKRGKKVAKKCVKSFIKINNKIN